MNWIKTRLTERTSWDGIVLVAAGVAMILAPVSLVAYAMIAYGAWTIWKSEQYVGQEQVFGFMQKLTLVSTIWYNVGD